MLPTPRSGLRRGITATERSELPTALNSNEEFYRIPDQRRSFTDASQFLGAREQVIIECHSLAPPHLRLLRLQRKIRTFRPLTCQRAGAPIEVQLTDSH